MSTSTMMMQPKPKLRGPPKRQKVAFEATDFYGKTYKVSFERRVPHKLHPKKQTPYQRKFGNCAMSMKTEKIQSMEGRMQYMRACMKAQHLEVE